MEEAVANIRISDDHEAVITQATELHGQALLELLYSYVQNRELAEDLTQEVFIKCYQKLHQYNGKAKFKTWLWQISINHCQDYHRRY